MLTRRNVLIGAASAGLASGSVLDDAREAVAAALASPRGNDWDQGRLVHLLPTVSHDRFLLKASFDAPLTSAPQLAAGNTRVRGERNTASGDFWQFDVTGLKPATEYLLSLTNGEGRALSEPWPLSTFPEPGAAPSRLRLLIFSCAGGHDIFNGTLADGRTVKLPMPLRRRLLERGLSFKPDALIANGDHVYWDINMSPALRIGGGGAGVSPVAIAYAGSFDRSQPVLGTVNERVLYRAAGEQIVPLYGARCRSTPVFFMTDDHDYFENDDANDEFVTFPPDAFMLNLARATRQLYYPEFLPDPNRPLGLPGASAADRAPGVAEAFGTLRYGKLAEILMYDVRRSQTLSGPSAVFLDPTVETWLTARMAARDVSHVVNMPSNPPGWSAGKWGEWYPDILGDDDRLTTKKTKPYWQTGWLKQHDRLMAAIGAMPERIPLVVSGDLHAIAEGRMRRSGVLEFAKNPIVTVLPGPLGVGDQGWPSGIRGVGATPPEHLDMEEPLKPLEENGFTIADFTPESITLRFFRFNYHKDSPEVIGTLQPFRVTELKRPG